jgi:outer membrane protein TolC
MNKGNFRSSLRRHRFAAVALAAALLTGAGPASALQPLSEFLASARSKAVENREAKLTVAQREAEADQAWGRILPAFTARASYTRNENNAEICQKPAPQTCTDDEKIVISPNDQLDASFSLEVPIIDVAGWNRVGAARASVKAASARAQATAQDVDRSLAQRYFQAIAAQALIDAANRALAAAEASQKVAVAREGAGATSALEIDRAEAEVARAQQSVADATQLRAVSRRAIESGSGLAPSQGAPAFSDDLRDEGPVDAWEKGAGETPAVRAAHHEKEAAEKSATAAWAALLPTVSATATERLTNATGFAGQISNYTIALTATLRLDFTGVRGGAVQEAAADASSLRRERAERDAKDRIFEAHQQVTTAIAKAKAARAQVKAADRAASIARDRYAQGAGTQLEVIQADRDAFQAEVARIQADADLAFARVALRLAAGRPLDGVKDAAGGSGATASSAAQNTVSNEAQAAKTGPIAAATTPAPIAAAKGAKP